MSTTSAEGRIRLSLDGSSLTAGVAKSKDALQKMDEVLRRTGPALGDMSKASKAAGLGVDLLSGGILGAVKTMGPWGLAIGVGADALIGLVASSEAAEKASRAFAKAQEDERKAVLEAADAIARKAFWEKELERDLRRASAVTTPRIREIEEEIAATRGWGESTAELTRELSKLTAAELRQQKMHRAGLETLAEAEARGKDLERQAQEIERKQRLADIEEEAAREKRTAEKITVGGKSGGGAAKPKEKADNSFADKAAVSEWEKLMDARDEQRKAKREQDELDFQTRDEKFDIIMRERADALEEAKDKAHEAEMARIKEEKDAREEQLAMQQRIVDAAAGYAGQAVAGLLSISDARKQARAAALAQGKSEAEAARAAKVAELQARASAMTGIRNMAAVKSAEHLALGIGALATTWGIPNPSAALHFAASGLFGVLAGAAAARASSLGDRAAGMEGGGGFGAGFGSPGAGGQGGAANSAPSASTQPGAGNSVPGSPVPQPQAGGQSSGQGGTVVHIHGNVIGNRQFVDDLARQLDEREHRRPRRAAGGNG